MTAAQIVAWSGGGVLLLLTLVQIAPIKFDPWTMFARWIGRAINAEVLKELEEVKQKQTASDEKLNSHIEKDDEREIDHKRAEILQFNVELIRHDEHTWEAFIEILKKIDDYEQYCRTHPDYANGRCVHAVENIHKVYGKLLETGGFVAM